MAKTSRKRLPSRLGVLFNKLSAAERIKRNWGSRAKAKNSKEYAELRVNEELFRRISEGDESARRELNKRLNRRELENWEFAHSLLRTEGVLNKHVDKEKLDRRTKQEKLNQARGRGKNSPYKFTGIRKPTKK